MKREVHLVEDITLALNVFANMICAWFQKRLKINISIKLIEN